MSRLATSLVMQVGSRTPLSLLERGPGRATFPVALAAFALAQLVGCATLPPGAQYHKQASVAFAHPQDAHIAQVFAPAAAAHSGDSAFRILSRGIDGFSIRMQLIQQAQHALDLQYFIFRQDHSGQMITEALLQAADRGVHLRLLVDDGATLPGDGRIVLLAAHPNVEVRIFNPFAYRGNSTTLRAMEFALHHRRLDYRMHNKLLVADNASALIGGRNVGDQYFQIDPQGQYADDDVFVSGPTVQKLSATFDNFWNSALAIPVEALSGGHPSAAQLAAYRDVLAQAHQKAQQAGAIYLREAASGEPLAGILKGELPVVWAPAQVVCDPPDKINHQEHGPRRPFVYEPVTQAVAAVHSEFLMITPYFIPTPREAQALKDLRQRNVRVGVLTNSLESTTEVSAHAGYQRHRTEMLQAGVELHEVRAAPDTARGTGQPVALSRYGNYGLHAKLYAFDRSRLFIGSMNFDQRSARLNTEIGLLIESSELAQQAVARYDAMTQLANAYQVTLQADPTGHSHPLWRTSIEGKLVETKHEPSRNAWRGLQDDFLRLMPIDDEL